MEIKLFESLEAGDVFLYGSENKNIWCKVSDVRAIGVLGMEKGKGLVCAPHEPCTLLGLGDICQIMKEVKIPAGSNAIAIRFLSEDNYTNVALTYDAPGNGQPGAVMTYETISGVYLTIYPKDSPDCGTQVLRMD